MSRSHGAHDGHAPTIGMSNRLWNLSDEEVEELFENAREPEDSE
jgi:hypothetical protein